MVLFVRTCSSSPFRFRAYTSFLPFGAFRDEDDVDRDHPVNGSSRYQGSRSVPYSSCPRLSFVDVRVLHEIWDVEGAAAVGLPVWCKSEGIHGSIYAHSSCVKQGPVRTDRRWCKRSLSSSLYAVWS